MRLVNSDAPEPATVVSTHFVVPAQGWDDEHNHLAVRNISALAKAAAKGEKTKGNKKRQRRTT